MSVCTPIQAAFFARLTPLMQPMATRMGVDVHYFPALCAFEDAWGHDAHNDILHDLFGVTKAGGRNLSFPSDQACCDYWEIPLRSAQAGSAFLDLHRNVRCERRPRDRLADHGGTSRMPLTLVGRDGTPVTIPRGGRGLQGRDGRMVAIPKGCQGMEGRDGRMAAIRPGGRGLQGRDGRMVAVPKGGQGVEGRDGRMAAIPRGGQALQGRDGRMVAVPRGRHAFQDAAGRVQVSRKAPAWRPEEAAWVAMMSAAAEEP